METILDLQRLEAAADSSPIAVISLTSSSSQCCNSKLD